MGPVRQTLKTVYPGLITRGYSANNHNSGKPLEENRTRITNLRNRISNLECNRGLWKHVFEEWSKDSKEQALWNLIMRDSLRPSILLYLSLQMPYADAKYICAVAASTLFLSIPDDYMKFQDASKRHKGNKEVTAAIERHLTQFKQELSELELVETELLKNASSVPLSEQLAKKVSDTTL